MAFKNTSLTEPDEKQPFFISTAIPYVNACPHIGFALESIQADVIARFWRLKEDEVFFLSGTDENALKNVLAAREAGIPVKDFVDTHAAEFSALKISLGLSWDDFIRTTEERHRRAAEKLWHACAKDIYKKKYAGLYCVGCEEFKTEKELVNGHCPEHPNRELERIEEENYFFRLSAYQERLEKIIESDEIKIFPETRKNEIRAFIHRGLEDFSISRSSARAQGWGIPVPGDPEQVMYVWFDALVNYISAIGYADDSQNFKKFWENGKTAHLIGKGITRFHAIYWPAMLLSAGVRLPKEIFVHGYVTVDGQKISKSLSNTVDPEELVSRYGTDVVRYFLLREIPSGEDGDFSIAKLEERYNGDLANGIGNLVARVATLGEKISPVPLRFPHDVGDTIRRATETVFKTYESHTEEFRLNEALADIWRLVSFADKYVNETKPWTLEGELLKQVIQNAGYVISTIANLLEPFLPETSEKIQQQIHVEGPILKIKKGKSLFPRLKK